MLASSDEGARVMGWGISIIETVPTINCFAISTSSQLVFPI